MFVALGALLKVGDRLAAARSLFGLCFVVQRDPAALGVETVFVDGEDLQQWEQALSVPTTAVFFETPSNPMQTSSTSPPSPNSRMRPARRWCSTTSSPPRCCSAARIWADVIVYSATKHIDGQGRVLGGAVRRQGVHRRPGAATDAAHRPRDERVQRVAAAQGPGDDEAATDASVASACASRSSWRPTSGCAG